MDPVTKGLVEAYQAVQDQQEAMILTKADKKGNTPAWQNRDKKNPKTGKPIYKKADHLNNEEVEPVDESIGTAIDKTLDAAGAVASTAIKAPARAVGYVAGLPKGIKKSYQKGKKKAETPESYEPDVEVIEKLVESGMFTDVEIAKLTNIQEADIADILAQLEKKRIRQGGDPDESPLGKKTGRAMKAQQDKARSKK